MRFQVSLRFFVQHLISLEFLEFLIVFYSHFDSLSLSFQINEEYIGSRVIIRGGTKPSPDRSYTQRWITGPRSKSNSLF